MSHRHKLKLKFVMPLDSFANWRIYCQKFLKPNNSSKKWPANQLKVLNTLHIPLQIAQHEDMQARP